MVSDLAGRRVEKMAVEHGSEGSMASQSGTAKDDEWTKVLTDAGECARGDCTRGEPVTGSVCVRA